MKRSGRKSAAQTPASASERIKGSSINKPGSASSKESASGIVLSESIIEVLREKADKFNEDHPKNRVGLSELKAVMRRGMGAYSTSHRPTISGGKPNSRTAWGYARVNRFLEKKAGKKVKEAYVQDDDLLEGGGEIELLAPNGQPSNLSPEQYRLVRTPEFKAWFGDWEHDPENASKVVDENGEPKVVYHYARRLQYELDKFFVFRTTKQLGSHFGSLNQISNLSPNAKYKIDNNELDFRFYEVFLNIRNPLRLKDVGIFDEQTILSAVDEIKPLQSYDWEYFNQKSKNSERLNRIKDWVLRSLYIDGVIYLNRYESDAAVSFVNSLENVSDEVFKIKVPSAEDSWIAFYPNQIKLADGSNTTFDGENPDIRFDEGGQVELLAPNGQPSNLSPEQYRLVRTPDFKAWFGDWENNPASASKVLDQNGEPLVCFHGSPIKNITEFDIKEGSKSLSKMQLLFGSHFASDYEDASIYAKGIGRIYDVFLSIKNPIDLSVGYVNKHDKNFDYYLSLANDLKLDKKYKNVFDYTVFTSTGDYGGLSNEIQRIFITQNMLDALPPQKVKAALLSNGFDGVIYIPYKPIGLNTASSYSKSFIALEKNSIKLADGSNTTFDSENPDIRFDEGGNVNDTLDGGDMDEIDWESIFNIDQDEAEKNYQKSIDEEREEWYQKSKWSKKYAATYKDAVNKTLENYIQAKKSYDDWASRQYKPNKSMVFLGGDDVFGESRSIGSINEGRRQRVLRGAKMTMDESIESFKELGLSDSEIAELIEKNSGMKGSPIEKFDGGGQVETGYTVIDEVLKLAKPLQDKLVREKIEKMEADGIRVTNYDKEMFELEMVYDLVKALANYVTKGDKLISANLYSDKGVITIIASIDRDGDKKFISTQMIVAGGYNIQQRHYRYIVDTNLPRVNSEVVSSKIEDSIKRVKKQKSNISKVEKERGYIQKNESRLADLRRLYEESKDLTDAEIWNKLLSSDKESDKLLIRLATADFDFAKANFNQYYMKDFETEADWEQEKKKKKEEEIERWKDSNIRHREVDIKRIEDDIKKIKKRIDKIESETFSEGGRVHLLAPNGQPSNLSPEQYRLVRTPEFKAWFGDWENDPKNASKVLDQNGEPLVCFHGTGSEFNIFKIGRTGGLFFTNKENSAKRFSEGDLKREGDSPKILKVFLKIKKPFSKYVIDEELVNSYYDRYFNDRPWINKKSQKIIKKRSFFAHELLPLGIVVEEALKEVLKRGYDGLIFQADMGSTTFVVFDSNQIKLADGSNTTFDSENPDIRFDDGGTVGLLAPNGQPSNLSPEQYRLVRTPEFKAWFGDWENDPENASKVVDQNGEPLVIYRGDEKEFGEYGYEYIYGFNLLSKPNPNNFGFFFTDDKQIAEKYTKTNHWGEMVGGSVTSYFFNARNILDLTDFELKIGQADFVNGLFEKGIKFDEFKYLPNHIINYFDKNRYIGWGAWTFDYFDVFPELRDLFISNGYDGIMFMEDSRAYSPYKVYVAFYSNDLKLADGRNTTFDPENPDIRFDDGGEVPPNFEIGASYPYPPAEISDYVKESDYWLPIRKFYFESEDAPLSSRYHPYLGELPKVGSWRISRLNLMDGHEIEYLAELPIDILTPKELDSEGNLDASKRGDDERYAEWIKAGFRPIPIEVVQTDAGKFLITDGHRRYLAHKLAGKDTIEAWVSYSTISPRGTIVGLTYELAHPDKEIPSFELGGAINESNDLTFASYNDALLWVEKESKKYKNKNQFYSSPEYREAYPVINELFMLERKMHESKERELAKIAMKEAAIEFGDKVTLDLILYLQVHEFTGTVVNRNGIPYVKLDEGQQTMSGQKSVKWHKGWRKITEGEETNE